MRLCIGILLIVDFFNPLCGRPHNEEATNAAVPALKAVLQGANYGGALSKTKFYHKNGGRQQAMKDFNALKPKDVFKVDNRYIMGKVNNLDVHLYLRPEVELLLQGKKSFRQIRY